MGRCCYSLLNICQLKIIQESLKDQNHFKTLSNTSNSQTGHQLSKKRVKSTTSNLQIFKKQLLLKSKIFTAESTKDFIYQIVNERAFGCKINQEFSYGSSLLLVSQKIVHLKTLPMSNGTVWQNLLRANPSKHVNFNTDQLLIKKLHHGNRIKMKFQEIQFRKEKSRTSTGTKYQEQCFKTSKQCREHWNNYLNPNVLRTNWSKEQDQLLIKHVIEKGKQWSLISKHFQSTRTEHMVKNRFKSLVLTYSKKLNISQKICQSTSSLRNIYKQLKNERQQVQQQMEERSYQEQQENQKQSQKNQELNQPNFQYPNFIPQVNFRTVGLTPSLLYNTTDPMNFQFLGSPLFSNIMIPLPPYQVDTGRYVANLFVRNIESQIAEEQQKNENN